MRRLLITAALFFALFPAAAARAETLPEGWLWKRPLAFRPMVTDAPGDNIAWAEFFANSAQQPDGSDIRVTTPERVVVPHKLLQIASDHDLIRIAFTTHGDGPYFVWWGNPKAEKPAKELDIKRGIYLEVSRFSGPGGGGGGGRGGRGAAAALDMPQGPVLASYFLPEISLGYNPFGDERQIMLHYTGAFKLDRALKAQMAFTVNDSGILQIDGKEIERQVRTGLRGQVRQSTPVDLAVGWHTLDIRQINQNAGNVVMALVWQRPGEKAFTPFPVSLFAPAARATAGALEKSGGVGTFSADMTIEPTAEGFLPPASYAPRYTFDAIHPTSVKPNITWDFGDGQVVTGQKKVSHMYLSPGIYPVTLKLEVGNNVMSTTVRLAVRDRLYEKFPRPTEDPPAAIRAALKEYHPDKLPAEQAFRGMLFFENAAGGGAQGDLDLQVQWGKAWLAGTERVPMPDNVVFDETFTLARLLIGRKDYKTAADIFRLASLKPIGMETRANLMRHEVMTLCDYADDADAALAGAQAWEKKISTTNKMQVRAVQVALAYAQIAKGDGKAAKAAIDAAVAAGTTRNAATFNQAQVRAGVLTRNVENYLRTKDLDTAVQLLNQWELEFPDALWEGFTRTLRVKLAADEGRNLVAARIAVAHARANPQGFYAAELLYRAAENFKLAGEAPQAATAMDLLKSKYPESPYAREGG